MQDTAQKRVDERKSWDWRLWAEWRFLKTTGVMVRMRETEVQKEAPASPSCQEGVRVTSQPLTPTPHCPVWAVSSPPLTWEAPHANVLPLFLYFFGLSLFLLLGYPLGAISVDTLASPTAHPRCPEVSPAHGSCSVNKSR